LKGVLLMPTVVGIMEYSKKIKRMGMEIKNWEDVDLALKELASLEVKRSEIEGELNERINELKKDAKKRVAPILEQIKHITKLIELFAINKKSEFAKKRTKELTFGKIGFRLVTSVSIPRDKAKVEALLKGLKAYGLSDCIKYEEKPDKEKLKELDDTTLVKLGLEKKVKDSFRIEPYLEKIKEG